MSRTLAELPRRGVLFLESILGFTLFGSVLQEWGLSFVGIFACGLVLGIFSEYLRYRDKQRIIAERIGRVVKVPRKYRHGYCGSCDQRMLATKFKNTEKATEIAFQCPQCGFKVTHVYTKR